MQASTTVNSKIKIAIAVLLALLILSAGALISHIIYLNFFADRSDTAIVPDNLIGAEEKAPVLMAARALSQEKALIALAAESTATVTKAPAQQLPQEAVKGTEIALYKGQATDNEKFSVQNMLPGDAETKYFAVKVNHGDEVTVYFKALITEETKKLGEALQIRVSHPETGEVIFEGSFSGINGKEFTRLLPKTESKESVAYYKVEVSFPTSAGNEYQAARLMADFSWYVEDDTPLLPPSTGDFSLLLWAVPILSSLGILLLLLIRRKKEKEESHAN